MPPAIPPPRTPNKNPLADLSSLNNKKERVPLNEQSLANSTQGA